MKKCTLCGLTELDGAPDLGVPHPTFVEINGQVVCEICVDTTADGLTWSHTCCIHADCM